MDKIFDNVHKFETYKPVWVDLVALEELPQPWFWEGFIPSSTLTLFAGKGGIGKSLLLLTLAAHVSSGKSFNAGGLTHQLPHGSVLLLSAEDDPQYQIKPKLVAAEADLSKIHYIQSLAADYSRQHKFLDLNKDIDHLELKIQELKDVKLIIIDPITYFIGDIKDNYNKDVADFLQKLINLSKKYELAIILNKHLRKSANGSNGASIAADEIGGAGAWINTPRKSWLITNYHEDEKVKVITDIKSNLNEKSEKCLAFKISPYSIEAKGRRKLGIIIKTTVLEWLPNLITMTADDAVNKEKYIKNKIDYAVDLIYKYIEENGQSLRQNIRDHLLKKGVAEITFKRACKLFKDQFKDVLIIEKTHNKSEQYMFKPEKD